MKKYILIILIFLTAMISLSSQTFAWFTTPDIERDTLVFEIDLATTTNIYPATSETAAIESFLQDVYDTSLSGEDLRTAIETTQLSFAEKDYYFYVTGTGKYYYLDDGTDEFKLYENYPTTSKYIGFRWLVQNGDFRLYNGTGETVSGSLQVYQYATDPIVHENLWYTQSNLSYWNGHLGENVGYTVNYFAKYINQVIRPLSSSSAEFSANIATFVNQVKTTGLVIELPDNLETSIFLYAYFAEAIDPWVELDPAEEIVLIMTDLVVEGINYTGDGNGHYVDEAWGQYLIYVVDSVEYEANQVDEFDNIVSPHIGIRVLIDDVYTISFDTNGGSFIASQEVLSGTYPQNPAIPTLAGHTFYGWKLLPGSYIIENGQYPEIYWPGSMLATQDRTYYAMWKATEFSVTLVVNGGSLIAPYNPGLYGIPGTPRLYVEYQDDVYTNKYGVDFDEMVSRSGFVLIGWFTNSEMTVAFDPLTLITANITIYAKWEATYSQVADLPDTEGNPYVEGETGTATFFYNPSEFYFEATITYDDLVYIIRMDDISFSDDNFLSNVATVDYYSVDGEFYLQFNYSSTMNVLLNNQNLETKHWNGFGVWNLSTDELVVTNRAWVLTYINVDKSTRDAYAYMYIPNIVIDKLLAVSVTFDYQYQDWLGKFGAVKTANKTLEADETSFGDNIPQWSYDTLTVSLPALAVGGILSLIPGGQLLGFPLLAMGGIGLSIGAWGGLASMVVGNINEIEQVTPSQTLTDTINDHFTTLALRPINITDSENLYRLYLGKYSSILSQDVRIDNSTYKYTEITWATNGEIYSLTEEYIDQESILDEDYVERLKNQEEDGLGALIERIIFVVVTLVFVISAIFYVKVFEHPLRAIPLIILYVVVLYVIGIIELV